MEALFKQLSQGTAEKRKHSDPELRIRRPISWIAGIQPGNITRASKTCYWNSATIYERPVPCSGPSCFITEDLSLPSLAVLSLYWIFELCSTVVTRYSIDLRLQRLEQDCFMVRWMTFLKVDNKPPFPICCVRLIMIDNETTWHFESSSIPIKRDFTLKPTQNTKVVVIGMPRI